MNASAKRCTKCKQELPATTEFFHKRASASDGLQAWCKTCVASYDTLRHAVHLDEYRERSQRWQADNPDKNRERNRRYRKRNADKVRESQKLYRAQRPEVSRGNNQRRRAHKRNLLATFTASDWTRCLEYWRHSCAYCGRPKGLWHTLAQDHWIPLAKGGTYTPDNILPACHGVDGCNNSKIDKNGEAWLIERFGERKAKQILRRIKAYFDTVLSVA